MPAITRWFRVTHDINADPELWELREQFGDRAGFVWLEILSIADRNKGFVGPDSPHLHAVLASKCRVYSPKVRAILVWCLGKGWLELRDGLRVVKWRKYNKTRDSDEQTSHSETTPIHDITTKEEEKIKNPPSAPSKKTKTSFPDDFEVKPELLLWALEHEISDPEKEVEAFRDYHVSKANRFLDWNAAFRTWLRNSKRFRNNGQVQPNQPARDQIARLLKRGVDR